MDHRVGQLRLARRDDALRMWPRRAAPGGGGSPTQVAVVVDGALPGTAGRPWGEGPLEPVRRAGLCGSRLRGGATAARMNRPVVTGSPSRRRPRLSSGSPAPLAGSGAPGGAAPAPRRPPASPELGRALSGRHPRRAGTRRGSRTRRSPGPRSAGLLLEIERVPASLSGHGASGSPPDPGSVARGWDHFGPRAPCDGLDRSASRAVWSRGADPGWGTPRRPERAGSRSSSPTASTTMPFGAMRRHRSVAGLRP